MRRPSLQLWRILRNILLGLFGEYLKYCIVIVPIEHQIATKTFSTDLKNNLDQYNTSTHFCSCSREIDRVSRVPTCSTFPLLVRFVSLGLLPVPQNEKIPGRSVLSQQGCKYAKVEQTGEALKELFKSPILRFGSCSLGPLNNSQYKKWLVGKSFNSNEGVITETNAYF